MKFNSIFMVAAALMISANSHATLSVYVGNQLVYGTEDGVLISIPIDFGDVCTDPSFNFPPLKQIEVTVKNDDMNNPVGSLTVSISGNSSELCIAEGDPDEPTICPPSKAPSCSPLVDGSLPAAEECSFIITLEPKHFGKKKKKLTIDGVDNSLNDISLTIPVTGSNNNLNSSLDSGCFNQ